MNSPKPTMRDVLRWRKQLEVGASLVLVNAIPLRNLPIGRPRKIEYRSSTSVELEPLSKAKIGFWVDIPTIRNLVASTEDTYTIKEDDNVYTFKLIPKQEETHELNL